MTHEFKNIIEQAVTAKQKHLKSVLASVVALDGSSYRRPGVRMLILENDEIIGAVSGGCVEKEILLQAQSVFKTGRSKIMTYDGRYRLGCEGILYILLEELTITSSFQSVFQECLKHRKAFEVWSYYKKSLCELKALGTLVIIDNVSYPLSGIRKQQELPVFKQDMPPCFQLVIIGAEHDAVQLCNYATLTGWEVIVVGGASASKSIGNFPGALKFIGTSPEAFDFSVIDNETAVVLMTHNFATDLRFLVALKSVTPSYIGLLGPLKRREDLLSQLIEYCPDISEAFLETIHGPAGLNIGSETPQEIAVSIVAEILAVTRKREPISLSKKITSIHTNQ